jgi:hypothetical protein
MLLSLIFVPIIGVISISLFGVGIQGSNLASPSPASVYVIKSMALFTSTLNLLGG